MRAPVPPARAPELTEAIREPLRPIDIADLIAWHAVSFHAGRAKSVSECVHSTSECAIMAVAAARSGDVASLTFLLSTVRDLAAATIERLEAM